MPGGWTMSMTWMLMPEQNWFFAAVSFLGMWLMMMMAMMLPSLVPILQRYCKLVDRTCKMHLGRLTVLIGVGYFFVWILFGILVFPLGVFLAAIEMQDPALARAVPIAVGVLVLIAGSFQFTSWKLYNLDCYLETPNQRLPVRVSTALLHGLHLGLHCVHCCTNLIIILLVIGVMDLKVMAAVTAAITIERLAPGRERIAKVIGIVIVGAGLFLIIQAAIVYNKI